MKSRQARDPRYARDKFENAVYALAVGPGDVRSRLYSAFVELLIVTPDDLPSSLRRRYRSVRSRLSKHEARGREGRVLATLSRMRNATGAKIAKDIVTLYHQLDEYVQNSR